MKDKIIVYTAISNNYDDLKEPKVISSNCDYVCFTDNLNLKSRTWKIRKFPDNNLDPVRKNRKVKILPHLFFPEYEYSIYIDGNIEIIGNLENLVNEYLIKRNFSIALLKHPKRNGLYEEARACIEFNKDEKKIILNQVSKYEKLGFPKNIGLTANHMLIRRHNNPFIIQTMEDWWQEVFNYSKRDQLSFCFAAWKNNLKYAFIKENINKEEGCFCKKLHKKEKPKRIRQFIINNRQKNIFLKFIYLAGKFLLNFYRNKIKKTK